MQAAGQALQGKPYPLSASLWSFLVSMKVVFIKHQGKFYSWKETTNIKKVNTGAKHSSSHPAFWALLGKGCWLSPALLVLVLLTMPQFLSLYSSSEWEGFTPWSWGTLPPRASGCHTWMTDVFELLWREKAINTFRLSPWEPIYAMDAWNPPA